MTDKDGDTYRQARSVDKVRGLPVLVDNGNLSRQQGGAAPSRIKHCIFVAPCAAILLSTATASTMQDSPRFLATLSLSSAHSPA